MYDFKCKYLTKGETKTYVVKAQKSKVLALAAWRFYCTKKQIRDAQVISFEQVISSRKMPVVGCRLSVVCYLFLVIGFLIN